MGRSFNASRVAQKVKTNLAIPRYGNHVKMQPPRWLAAVEANPPPEILTRPIAVQHRAQRPTRSHKQKLPSNLYKPQQLYYPEDHLRRQFYKDHPWELARPRMIVEMDGKDAQRVDWSRGVRQPGVALTGECVVQRQLWLMENQHLTQEEAYDTARREFYALRQQEEIERRVAQEEARMVGGYFGLSRMQISERLEDAQYEKWKKWAEKNAVKEDAKMQEAYEGPTELDEAALDADNPTEREEVAAPAR